MRKAIAALLSVFVGLFGYAIVDETMESRVTNLESVVSSQQDEINSLHGIGEYSVTARYYDTTTHYHDTTSGYYESSTEYNTDWWTGWTTSNEDETYPWGGTDPTGYLTTREETSYTGTTARPTTGTTAPTTSFIDSEHAINTGRSLPDVRKVIIYDNGSVKLINVGDEVDESDSSYQIQEIRITDIKSKLISNTENTTYVYDENYNTQASVVNNTYVYHIEVCGNIDKSYAGKTITVDCYYNSYLYMNVPTLSGTVNDDGSFVCSGNYTSNTSLYRITVYPDSVK